MHLAPAILIVLASCGRIDFDPLVDSYAGRTVSFGETGTADYSGVTTDTFIDVAQPTLNYGAAGQIYSSGLFGLRQVALLRFDLVALAPGTHVISGELRLFVDNNAADTGAATFYRLLEPWSQGTQIGAAGAANWTQRTGSAVWTTPGADQPGSRDTISLASFAPSMTLTAYTVPLTSEGVATVYGWIADSTSNNGFAIVSDGDDWKFDSSENPTAANRPELVLQVSP